MERLARRRLDFAFEKYIVKPLICTTARCGFCRFSGLSVRHESKAKEVLTLAAVTQVKQPKIETEIKIGNTTYIVNGHYATEGVTVSEKIKRLLDRETKRKSC